MNGQALYLFRASQCNGSVPHRIEYNKFVALITDMSNIIFMIYPLRGKIAMTNQESSLEIKYDVNRLILYAITQLYV